MLTLFRQTAIGLNITKILNKFFDGLYDKRVRPDYAGNHETHLLNFDFFELLFQFE